MKFLTDKLDGRDLGILHGYHTKNWDKCQAKRATHKRPSIPQPALQMKLSYPNKAGMYIFDQVAEY
jgi:hypothetical protein